MIEQLQKEFQFKKALILEVEYLATKAQACSTDCIPEEP
jgi:hypothetical protein